MIVQVRHPSALLHVPRGARKERLDFRAIVTPVEVPDLEPGAFLPLHGLPARGQIDLAHDLFEREGALWTRIVGWGRDGMAADQVGIPFGREAFLRLLGGDVTDAMEKWYRHTDLSLALARSPVEARFVADGAGHPLFRATDPFGREHLLSRATSRGDEMDPATSRRVSLDDTVGAVAAATRFVSERLALMGDEVYFRVSGPLAAAHALPGILRAESYEACLFPYAEGSEGLNPAKLARADRAAAHRGAVDPLSPKGPVPSVRLQGLLGALGRVSPTDADVEAFANLAPQRVVRMGGPLLDEPYVETGKGRDRDLILSMLRPFEAWAVRGMTGSVPSSEAASIAAEAVELMRVLERLRPRNMLADMRSLARYAEGYVLGTALDTAPEDVEALSGVGGP